MEVDGEVVDGWFVQDFHLEELKQLRARERWPKKRPGSAMYDELLPVLTLEELLDLREQESARAGRQLGVHIELKHAALFTRHADAAARVARRDPPRAAPRLPPRRRSA